MDLSIIVPCHNEADNVPKLRDEFFPVVGELAKTRSIEVIFVDDGSRDTTWQVLNEAFGEGRETRAVVRFERHVINRGLGAAIRTGFAAARGEVVVTTDADGTYKFQEIPHLLARLTPDVDMVTASPYHPQGEVVGVPPYRLILSQGSSMIYRVLVNWNIYTYTALFRAYRRAIVEHVPFTSDGFLAGTEILVNGMLMGYRAVEHPAALHSRVFGVSKAKIARTIRAHLQYQARVLLHRLGVAPLVTAAKAVNNAQ